MGTGFYVNLRPKYKTGDKVFWSKTSGNRMFTIESVTWGAEENTYWVAAGACEGKARECELRLASEQVWDQEAI